MTGASSSGGVVKAESTFDLFSLPFVWLMSRFLCGQKFMYYYCMYNVDKDFKLIFHTCIWFLSLLKMILLIYFFNLQILSLYSQIFYKVHTYMYIQWYMYNVVLRTRLYHMSVAMHHVCHSNELKIVLFLRWFVT